jgi:hypothetical protein
VLGGHVFFAAALGCVARFVLRHFFSLSVTSTDGKSNANRLIAALWSLSTQPIPAGNDRPDLP